MPSKETLDVMRSGAKELAQKIRQIDPKLFVVLSAGDPAAVKNLPVIDVGTLPASVLAVLKADGWEQQSWQDIWKDSSGWTDVWGQSPPPTEAAITDE